MNTLTIQDINTITTKDITKDITEIIEQSQRVAYSTIDLVLLKRNWLIGKRIYEEEFKKTRKENYGKEIIKTLAGNLSKKYGGGFDTKTLYKYVKFYTMYKNIFASVRRQSFLSWTHYRLLIRITNKDAREWYEKELMELK